MNTKKFIITIIAVFFTVLLTDFLTHQVFLKGVYGATQSLWRTDTDIQAHIPYMFGGQLLVSIFMAWIFIHGYKGKGIIEGLRFGFFIGSLEMGRNLIMYAVAPYPCNLTSAWILAGYAQAMLIGIVASFTYKV